MAASAGIPGNKTDQHHIVVHPCEMFPPSCLPSLSPPPPSPVGSLCSQAQPVMMNVEQGPAPAPAITL
ncbi:hypothetical protein CgunFtcFv8_022500 [Champsocephalus gunnari]|uniref:Uncharacterized protein n=1 Tax=Champsocephalus gunnari TaxID=52237 RepID=A0AAN8DRE6_CHAGU|nr:hypothetical protein CgunFtcFv8_022500 [Champsocephalus gunnari]